MPGNGMNLSAELFAFEPQPLKPGNFLIDSIFGCICPAILSEPFLQLFSAHKFLHPNPSTG